MVSTDPPKRKAKTMTTLNNPYARKGGVGGGKTTGSSTAPPEKPVPAAVPSSSANKAAAPMTRKPPSSSSSVAEKPPTTTTTTEAAVVSVEKKKPAASPRPTAPPPPSRSAVRPIAPPPPPPLSVQPVSLKARLKSDIARLRQQKVALQQRKEQEKQRKRLLRQQKRLLEQGEERQGGSSADADSAAAVAAGAARSANNHHQQQRRLGAHRGLAPAVAAQSRTSATAPMASATGSGGGAPPPAATQPAPAAAAAAVAVKGSSFPAPPPPLSSTASSGTRPQPLSTAIVKESTPAAGSAAATATKAGPDPARSSTPAQVSSSSGAATTRPETMTTTSSAQQQRQRQPPAADPAQEERRGAAAAAELLLERTDEARAQCDRLPRVREERRGGEGAEGDRGCQQNGSFAFTAATMQPGPSQHHPAWGNGAFWHPLSTGGGPCGQPQYPTYYYQSWCMGAPGFPPPYYYHGHYSPYPASQQMPPAPPHPGGLYVQQQPPRPVVASALAPPAPPGPRALPPPPKAETKRGTNLLAAHPLQPPSPFAATYFPQIQTVTLIKKQGESSFGVTLQLDVGSALVDPDSLLESKKPEPAVKKVDETAPSSREPSWQETVVEKSKGVTAPDEARRGTAAGDQQKGSPAAPITSEQHHLSVAETQADEKGAPGRTESKFAQAGKQNVTGNAQGTGSFPVNQNSAVAPSQSRRKRRRRVFFSVMTVLEPTVQNERIQKNQEDGKQEPLLLQKGDLVLSINGRSTAGLEFRQAVALFQQSKSGDDGIIRCEVELARRKPEAEKKMFPFAIAPHKQVNDQKLGPLDETEIIAFATITLKAAMDPRRLLGSPDIPYDLLRAIVTATPALARRQAWNLMLEWEEVRTRVLGWMNQAARAHWKEDWAKQPDRIRSAYSSDFFLTDAQRSNKRAALRPAKGCRCGSQEHQYMNDPSCPLYSNLRVMLEASGADFDDSAVSGPKRINLSSLPRGLNTVQKAFKERFVRMKTEQAGQEAEAKFVSLMEEVQLKQLQKAIFAPSLTAMVLSAVVELESEFSEMALEPLNNGKGSEIRAPSAADEEDSDEDDDVPLTALGKRPNDDNSQPRSPSKRQRGEDLVRFECLAKIAEFVSKKWGHVYREPSHAEYAWRWEVFHGQTSDSGSRWDAATRNPRKVNALSLENVQFLVNDKLVSQLTAPNGAAKEKAEALQVLASVLSPRTSGVCDELFALIRTDVVRVDARGVPTLTQDWWARVDLLLLDDMDRNWSVRVDSSGKYGISDTIRRTLSQQWVKTYDGWSFAQDPEDTIIDFDEFDDWRTAFEDKQEARSNLTDGIGAFN